MKLKAMDHVLQHVSHFDRGISVIEGAHIHVFADSASLISFEIDCFHVVRTRIYEYEPPQLLICRGPHRDYKRIEWASREKSRDKLNKSNGGSGI